jgi:hypothetical protein
MKSFTGSIMADHGGPSPVRVVEGNLSALSRRLEDGADVLDAQAGAPPQGCSADLNEQCRLTEAYWSRFEQGEGRRRATVPASVPGYPAPGQAWPSPRLWDQAAMCATFGTDVTAV